MAEYTLRTATVNDKKEIYELVAREFSLDMPLTLALNITVMPPIHEWSSLKYLDNGLTIVAISPDNRIVGVAINIEPKSSEENVSTISSVENFMKVVDEESKGLVDRLNKTTLELRIMAVSGATRGKGIAKRLIDETEKVAKLAGYSNIFGVATGAYMAAAFRRQEWVPSFTYFYENYLKHSLDFKLPPLPHNCLTIFEKAL